MTSAVGAVSDGLGTVQFYDASTTNPIGTPQSVNSGGLAVLTISTLNYGSHNIGAHYISAGSSSNFGDSTSETMSSILVIAPTQVVLTLPNDSPPIPVANAVTLTATVSCSGTCTGSPGDFSGTVQFFADGSTTAMAGSVSYNATTGVATLNVPGNTFTAAQHTFIATFTPVANGNYGTSTSSTGTIHFN